ncbi:MAG: hypothetical protein ACYTHK_04670 [Planctomycetota bacterium]
MERITFCAACGEPNPIKSARCESCDAPLRKVRDWKGMVQSLPKPTPLMLLVAAAVIALGIAVWTHFAVR